MRPTRPLRLLHTSDVHLGGLFAPEHGRHREHCLCPLLAIERTAIRRRVDAVLIAGDLFDHQRLSKSFVVEVMTRLDRLPVPCIVINGNHDLHDDASLYAWMPDGGPDGISDGDESARIVFLDEHGGTTATLLDGALSVWSKAMPSHDRDFRPLRDVPARPAAESWWVVMGHGHYEPSDPGSYGRSSPLTPAEIEATAADYVALGHWHVRTDVSQGGVPAWYSGAPFGVGASGRFNLAVLDPAEGVRIDEVPVELPPEGCGAVIPIS